MAEDTRKDPRAKVLSMTVRYKSATLEEFIEHHCHDVSRGGIFIKTPAPFAPGTLLKFEIRIQGEQALLAGVGRVVWKRDASSSKPTIPSGMGVKFIKIDDSSRALIDRLVDAQEGISMFEAGQSAQSPILSKQTMMGLGAISPSATTEASSEESSSALGKEESPAPKNATVPLGTFFPPLEDAVDAPPEEHTVIKQATELLQQALAETATTSSAEATVPQEASSSEKPSPQSAIESRGGTLSPRPKKTTSVRPKAEPLEADEPSTARNAPESSRDTGGGKIVFVLLAAAMLGVGVWFVFFGQGKQSSSTTHKPDTTARITETSIATTSTTTSTSVTTTTEATVASTAPLSSSTTSSSLSMSTSSTSSSSTTRTPSTSSTSSSVATAKPTTTAYKPPPKPKPTSDDPYE